MKKINKNITVEDQTVAVEIRDRGTDYAWVFLHGWGADKSVWAPVTNKLSATTITIDLPGFGQSSKLTEPKNTEDYSRYIREALSELTVKKVLLVGHSFGGQVAANIAADRPVWLAGLVLVGASAVRSEKPPFLSRVGSFLSPLFQLPGVRTLRPFLYRLIGADMPPDNKNLQQTMKTILREDQTSVLKNIDVPTKVIWGKDDQAVPLEKGKTITDKITNAKLSVLPGGHYAFRDSLEQFCSNLTNFSNSLKV